MLSLIGLYFFVSYVPEETIELSPFDSPYILVETKESVELIKYEFDEFEEQVEKGQRILVKSKPEELIPVPVNSPEETRIWEEHRLILTKLRAFRLCVMYKYLDCGDLHMGFARVRCEECEHEYLLAVSCKRRQFCPSCHQKRVVEYGEWLLSNVLKNVPHRQ